MAKVVHIKRDAVGVVDVEMRSAVISADETKRIFPDLIALAAKRDDYAEAYNAAVDAAAQRTGASKKAIKAVVRAISADKTLDMFADATEICDLLEVMVPGIAGRIGQE